MKNNNLEISIVFSLLLKKMLPLHSLIYIPTPYFIFKNSHETLRNWNFFI